MLVSIFPVFVDILLWVRYKTEKFHDNRIVYVLSAALFATLVFSDNDIFFILLMAGMGFLLFKIFFGKFTSLKDIIGNFLSNKNDNTKWVDISESERNKIVYKIYRSFKMNFNNREVDDKVLNKIEIFYQSSDENITIKDFKDLIHKLGLT